MTLTRVEVVARGNAVRLPTAPLPGRFDPDPLTLQRLERSNALLRAAFDAAEMPVAILDGTGRILLVNASWRDASAPSKALIEGDGSNYLDTGLPRTIVPRHAAALRTGLRKMFRRASEAFEHQVCVKQTGAERWYRIRATRVALGGLDRIVVTHEDVTALHAAKEAAKAMSRRMLALQEERRRIAVELRDSTCQQLTAASLHLLALRRTSQGDTRTLRTIEQIGQTIDEAQKEIRSFSYLLRPPYLDRDGLRTTLARFVEGYGARTGLRTTVQISDEVDGLSPAVQLALLRIVQEALSNVHRHAMATQILVRMRTNRAALFFTIRDNGKGMSQPAGRGDGSHDGPLGLGLPGMYARVGLLGGTLRILSGARGSTISGRLPLSRSEA